MGKKVLVLVSSYPDNNGAIGLMYVHSRNKYYIQHDIDVTVLRFDCNESYVIDGIKVISLQDYKSSEKNFDVLIMHAPNLRYHYVFFRKFQTRFKRILFFFHGHEVLEIGKVYPEPYDYMVPGRVNRLKQSIYDKLKLKIWRAILSKYAFKSHFVFVSNHYKEEAMSFLRLSDVALQNHVHVIYNCVGEAFQKEKYDESGLKLYDFIVIRGVMDSSATCIDLVTELAKRNPKFSFLVVGKGSYYLHNNKPENVKWIDRYLNHMEIIDLLNKSKCALNLTRRDTQGVMTCELATFGIPVITSNISVCQEVCAELKSVLLVENDVSKIDLSGILNRLDQLKKFSKATVYDYYHTVLHEEELIKGSDVI